MKVNTTGWKEFRFGDLISKIGKSRAINKGDLTEAVNLASGIRYITRTAENNGCEMVADISSIEEKYIQKGNAITIGDTTATCFYQPKDFITGDHMVVIRADWLNEKTGLFVASILNQEKYKYSYGRAFVKDKIKDTIIKLPATLAGEPDWQFMESYIKAFRYKPVTTKNNRHSSATALKTETWKEFTLNSLFDLKGGFFNNKPKHSTLGKIPFLASTESNNGVTEFYDIEDIRGWSKVGKEDDTLNKKMFKGNCITVTVNGSVCNAFYQPKDYTCSHDVTSLYLKGHQMNKYIGIFISTVITNEKYRWSYGRKPHDIAKFGNSIIKLPVTAAGEPDWQFMEDYIKSLPYGDRI